MYFCSKVRCAFQWDLSVRKVYILTIQLVVLCSAPDDDKQYFQKLKDQLEANVRLEIGFPPAPGPLCHFQSPREY